MPKLHAATFLLLMSFFNHWNLATQSWTHSSSTKKIFFCNDYLQHSTNNFCFCP
jgi:hypothetical protein